MNCIEPDIPQRILRQERAPSPSEESGRTYCRYARPYKEAESVTVAMECIRQERAKQFDPGLVDVFAELQPAEDLGRLSERKGAGRGRTTSWAPASDKSFHSTA
jgi:hypothetical protein